MWLVDLSKMSDSDLAMEIEVCKVVLSGPAPQEILDEAASNLEELTAEKDRRSKIDTKKKIAN